MVTQRFPLCWEIRKHKRQTQKNSIGRFEKSKKKNRLEQAVVQIWLSTRHLLVSLLSGDLVTPKNGASFRGIRTLWFIYSQNAATVPQQFTCSLVVFTCSGSVALTTMVGRLEREVRCVPCS